MVDPAIPAWYFWLNWRVLLFSGLNFIANIISVSCSSVFPAVFNQESHFKISKFENL